MTGCSQEEASKEVDIAIQRLFYWGAYTDKYGGTVQVGVGINQLKLTRIPCGTKFFREFIFADWRFVVSCGD